MRLRVMTFPLLVVLAVAAAATHGTPAFRAPKQANVTAACTPANNPRIAPASIALSRADNVEWHSVSPNATSWTITPKDTLDWPFAQRSFTGTPQSPATTPQPLPSAVANHPYHYKVTIRCSGMGPQVIDPDIIIGTGQ